MGRSLCAPTGTRSRSKREASAGRSNTDRGLVIPNKARNLQFGEVQQKLDIFANETIIKAMDHSGRLCGMASEEEAGIIPIPEKFRCGKYCLMFDPLDGSSNIDVNVPVGTIFSIVQKITHGKNGEEEDFLQPGRR